MNRLLPMLVISFTSIFYFADAQQTITFPSKDGLIITGDLYISSTKNPYILLCHQAGSSRGEYREIAPKLVNLGYNCLAIDQRSGKEVNFVKNETAIKAKEKNLKNEYIDALPDIIAAIDYIKNRTEKPIILWGSSYSASLALTIAPKELKVGALIVFSPGEYFEQPDYVGSYVGKISVPLLALSSKSEFADLEKLLTPVPKGLKTLFKPTDEGKHGSKALWENNPSNKEYWMAVTMFFSKLKK